MATRDTIVKGTIRILASSLLCLSPFLLFFLLPTFLHPFSLFSLAFSPLRVMYVGVCECVCGIKGRQESCLMMMIPRRVALDKKNTANNNTRDRGGATDRSMIPTLSCRLTLLMFLPSSLLTPFRPDSLVLSLSLNLHSSPSRTSPLFFPWFCFLFSCPQA